jgi:hypothetical protein
MARTAVIAGTATAVSGGVQNRQQQRFAAQQQAQEPAAAPTPEPAPAPVSSAGGDDVVSQLKELAELKATGILSDAEFEAAKAKVLAG